MADCCGAGSGIIWTAWNGVAAVPYEVAQVAPITLSSFFDMAFALPFQTGAGTFLGASLGTEWQWAKANSLIPCGGEDPPMAGPAYSDCNDNFLP